tara:strand:- start:1369 stop:1674 length:306 start_codon:yes stop_codon:yes gene_type:complete
MTGIKLDHAKHMQEKKFKSQLDRNIENNLKYWKRVKEELEMRDTKAKSIRVREQILQKQKADNYRREKERLLSILHNQSIPMASVNVIQNRLNEIKNFGIA